MNTFKKIKNAQLPIRLTDGFYPQAKALRSHFETRFKDPLTTRADKFIWDYWLVPDQYKLLRTPAESFFPPALYKPFLNHLLAWGRENLGCQMISHPWLSVYIDGCYQSLHSDVPHGPWSFVYSLTPWTQRKFKGGETVVAADALLNYFSQVSHSRSQEKKNFFTEIEPRFNRLTVFDPRYPHGVNLIQGEDQLLRARLVIHGWFTEPRPMIAGALTMKRALPVMDAAVEHWMEEINALCAYGLLSVRLTVAARGTLESATLLCGNLINDQGQRIPEAKLKSILLAPFKAGLRFPNASGKSTITIPVEFKQ